MAGHRSFSGFQGVGAEGCKGLGLGCFGSLGFRVEGLGFRVCRGLWLRDGTFLGFIFGCWGHVGAYFTLQ